MDLEEIGINEGNSVDSAQECGIEPPDSISHGVIIIIIIITVIITDHEVVGSIPDTSTILNVD